MLTQIIWVLTEALGKMRMCVYAYVRIATGKMRMAGAYRYTHFTRYQKSSICITNCLFSEVLLVLLYIVIRI